MAGKTGARILWLLTGGCFGIGAIVDFVMVCTGKFKDKNGEIWEAESVSSASYFRNISVPMKKHLKPFMEKVEFRHVL